MENNIVFVVDCCSRLRHCRSASSMAAVLKMGTRLLGFDCNKGPEIVTILRYKDGLMMELGPEIEILLLLADEALTAMRLKTFLLVPNCARAG
jgi:hypothetical protein